MSKFSKSLVMVCLLATLLAEGATTRAAMWVGPEIGGNFINNINVNFGAAKLNNVKVDPSVIGGITIGYDFVNTGFLGHNWPDWMKYLHFVTDFTYNRMSIPGQQVSGSIGGVPASISLPRIDGYMAALAAGFIVHYGFFDGRVNPYIGGGPAVLFSGIDLGAGSSSSAAAALWTEVGIRWARWTTQKELENFSIDTSYRFRWARPTYDINGTGLGFNGYAHSFLVRVNYHF